MTIERYGVAGELRMGEEVEQDVLAAHVRVHLLHIGSFMFVVQINRPVYVRGTN